MVRLKCYVCLCPHKRTNQLTEPKTVERRTTHSNEIIFIFGAQINTLDKPIKENGQR